MPRSAPSFRPGGRRLPDARPSSARRGYGAAWRRLRAMVLAKRPLCHCGAVATEVDHKDGNVRNLAEENLEPLCKTHHSRKTVAVDGGFKGSPRRRS